MHDACLYHDAHYDFVQDDNGPYMFATADGPKNYVRVEVVAVGGTTALSFPDDYNPAHENMGHLVESLTGRHVAKADIVSVSAAPGAEDIAAALADLLDATIIDHPEPAS